MLIDFTRLYLKNLFGWQTDKNLVAFAVDDYGNVRVHSKRAREKMEKAGLKTHTRFDAYDALETTDDLGALYETLSSVKDRKGNPAVFTPYALPCNIDFERVLETDEPAYYHELLPVTFSKLKGYEKTWALWQEGIKRGLMAPQFHGREHLNLKVFEDKWKRKDKDIKTALLNRSYTGLTTDHRVVKFTEAFAFYHPMEIRRFPAILESGLKAFRQVFGYNATAFTPPGQKFHPFAEPALWRNKVIAMDKPLLHRQHQGKGKFYWEMNTMKYHKRSTHTTLVRNVVFEPTDKRGVDWVAYTLKQIEAAFRLNRPALISSHRVNFCGHIDEKNRSRGLGALKELLKGITRRWPEVEFLSVEQLVKSISPQHV